MGLPFAFISPEIRMLLLCDYTDPRTVYNSTDNRALLEEGLSLFMQTSIDEIPGIWCPSYK